MSSSVFIYFYNYRPFWTDELEKLEDEVNKVRKDAEENPNINNNIKLKETTARLRRETISTQRKGWQEKTASLNLEKDGSKLWNLVATLNGEKSKSGPIVLEKEGTTVTGKEAANVFIKQYAGVSDIEINKVCPSITRSLTLPVSLSVSVHFIRFNVFTVLNLFVGYELDLDLGLWLIFLYYIFHYFQSLAS